MVRFSLSPKITLRKEKTRKNSESKENKTLCERIFGRGRTTGTIL